MRRVIIVCATAALAACAQESDYAAVAALRRPTVSLRLYRTLGEGSELWPGDEARSRRQTTELHHYGPGRVTTEPVFVPRSDGRAEDDGWVLSYVYDTGRNLSDVVILNASDFGGDPATIHLSVRVPFGFHGGWAPDDFAAPPLA